MSFAQSARRRAPFALQPEVNGTDHGARGAVCLVQYGVLGERGEVMRVLIIDDEPRLLRCMERALRRDHCDIVTADSASQAFRALAIDRFDAIVCDLHLAGMDGPTFFDKLSDLDADRVVFMTGGARNADDSAFLSRHRVVYKPFTHAELMSAISSAAA